MAAEALFWVQVTLALVFTVSQIVRMLSSTQGVSTSTFICSTIAVGISLALAFKAHWAEPSRVTLQIVVISTMGVLTYTSFVVVIAIWGDQPFWDRKDTANVTLAGIGTGLALLLIRAQQLPLSSPWAKCYLGIALKVGPQLVLAYKVAVVGGDGLSWVMVTCFHVLTLIRVGLTGLAVWEAPRERNRYALFIYETANELSWVLVSIVWLSV